jgi:hypothetical protein
VLLHLGRCEATKHHIDQGRSTCQVNGTGLCFEVADTVIDRPRDPVPRVIVEAGEDSLCSASGVVLWGPLLDRLGLIRDADRRGLRPIGPGGYSGGECYRALVELQLAGGDFLSDRSLLADEATDRLRGRRLPSTSTLWRFCAGADLGRAAKAAAVNRTMLGRAWALGAGPAPGRLTIDVDATHVGTYGPTKEASAFSYLHEVGLSPLVGVCGETGDVLAVRARGGNANPGRALGSFFDECVAAIPPTARDRWRLWVRSDSAGYRQDLVDAAEHHEAIFTITARQLSNVRTAIEELATDPAIDWVPALGRQATRGHAVAETTHSFAGRTYRLLVRRQPVAAGEQLSFDDLNGWRYQAVLTNAPATLSAAEVEHHHRLRGGAPEEAIRQLKHDFGLNHAPVANFYGNWLWWQAAALAYNTARWLRVLALPAHWHRCRGKRLRLMLLNVAGRVVRTGRRLILRLPRHYPHHDTFRTALDRIHRLPAFT